MKQLISILIFTAILFSAISAFAQKGGFGEIKQLQSPQNPALGFMIHGGAGVIAKGEMTPEKEKALRADLEKAVLAGYKALRDGKTSLDAVEIAIRVLEDSPLFNAGKGAIFNNEGKNELDASIMDGKTLGAGAVAAVHHVKNPITLARAVMEKSPYVMMVGDGAEKFAKERNIELVDEKYFWTQERWDEFQKSQVTGPGSQVQSPKSQVPSPRSQVSNLKPSPAPSSKSQDLGPTLDATHSILGSGRGTLDSGLAVGAVALDKNGNLAAGTSTGGLTNKKYGRVGEAPIIGAGTFANNSTCAVSATGTGEYFIRLGVARDISSLMEYRALPVQNAADMVIQQKLKKMGGEGGVIAMDKFGNMAISFNSEGMYRAYINSAGKPVVEIY